ncbi:MAG: phosphoglycerate kinase [Halobacteriaceae archaeon]
MTLPTLDGLDPEGQIIGVRVDINSPLNESQNLLDDSRLQAHLKTLNELLANGGKIGILAHQGRPGGKSFIPLETHANRLDSLLDFPIEYTDALFSEQARQSLHNLDNGEGVVLENTRFYSEEYMEFSPDRAANTFFVQKLSPVFDVYVNDAFGAAHRSQPSMVGFPQTVPAFGGRVLEEELSVLNNIHETDQPRVYVLGGAKVKDSLRVMEHILETGLADSVLTTGLVANLFLLASNIDIGTASTEILEKHDQLQYISRAETMLDTYSQEIKIPVDVAIEQNERRKEIDITDLPVDESPIKDIGSATINEYSRILNYASTVIVNGPAGVFEEEIFAYGTHELFETIAAADYSIAGGGDTGAAIRKFNISGFSHVSTGGGAALQLLSGQSLPAVEVLEES